MLEKHQSDAVRRVLDEIDAILVDQNDVVQRNVISVLMALRGPDEEEFSKFKGNSTSVIRSVALPKTFSLKSVQIGDDECYAMGWCRVSGIKPTASFLNSVHTVALQPHPSKNPRLKTSRKSKPRLKRMMVGTRTSERGL